MAFKIGIAYCTIAVVVFLVCIVFGKIMKKISLGKGVELGVVNSVLLSVFWPLTLLCSLAGWGYEAIRVWKKI